MANGEQQFDLEAARAAGHNDADIAAFLAQQRNFDIAGARAAGHNDANIIQILTTGRPFADIGQVAALGKGTQAGIAGILGAPVDIASAGLRAAGVPISEEPFLGSESIRRGLGAIGFDQVDVEQLPPEQRPAFIAGEVIGGSVIPGAAPVAAARFGAKGRGILKPIIAAAATAPKRFIAAETAAAIGAGAGGGAAEFVDPGDPTTRFLSEVAGGLFNPTAAAIRVGGKTVESVRNLTRSFSKSGREGKAAEVIRDIIAETGEDPAAVTNLLEKADVTGVKLTSGQKTGSPALLAMESKLASQSSRFAGEAEDLATNSLKQLRTLVDDFTKAGDPQSLAVAARLRDRYFKDLLDRRVDIAGQNALEARAGFGTESRADIAGISTEAKTILRDAMKDAREVETDLWTKIPKDTPLAADGIIDSFGRVRDRLLPEEALPGVTERVVKRLKKERDAPLDSKAFVDKMLRLKRDNKISSAGEIIKFRKRMLAFARDARGQNKFDQASQFDVLAEGALTDLNKLSGTEANNARSFSRQLNEKFTETFASQARGVTPRGGERIPAELMLERAFGSGGTRGELQLRELGEAADFPSRVFGGPMLDTQERFLQIASQSSIDASTGRVNPAKLREFLSKNQVTLDRFPDLKTKLSNASLAEEAFRGVEESGKTASKAIQQRAAFANLIKTDDPVVAVGNVLSGPNARREFTQLAKLAKRSGRGSVDGLRSASFKNAFDKATGNTGQFSFRRFDQILKKGLSKEDVGLLPLMRQTGVIDKNGADRLRQLVKRSIEIEDALGSQKKLDKLLENPDGLFDLVTRIVGAKIGAAGVAGGATGTSLIAAGAGSKFARNFAQKIPATKVSEVLEIAARDPKFMAMLLRKTKTIKAKAEMERQINAFLISAGLQFDETEQQ